MIDNMTPADLIYLYLDGEADSMQTTTMFASLATDVDLQQEFSEALSMHRAFEHERTHTKPPMYLTNRVFQDAGILPKAIGASAVGGGLWLWLRRAAVPVGALMIGSVLTFFGMSWAAKQTQTPALATNQHSLNASSATPSIAAAPAVASTATAKGGAPSFAKEGTGSSPVRHAAQRNPGQTQEPNRQRPATPTENTISTDAVDYRDGIGDSFLAEQSMISPAAFSMNSLSSRKLSMVRVGMAPLASEKSSDWTLQLNRLMGGDVFGSAHSTPVTIAADPSIALFYNMNENFSLGASYSQSSYSVSDITMNGVTLQNPRLAVYSIEAQLMSEQEYILGAQGYARFALGISTNTGSTMEVGAINAGLSFPVSVLRLNTGVAMEGMYYRSQSQFPLRGKISFVMGLSWNVNL